MSTDEIAEIKEIARLLVGRYDINFTEDTDLDTDHSVTRSFPIGPTSPGAETPMREVTISFTDTTVSLEKRLPPDERVVSTYDPHQNTVYIQKGSYSKLGEPENYIDTQIETLSEISDLMMRKAGEKVE